MKNQNKSPALAATNEPGKGNNRRTHPTRQPPKWKRVLAALAAGRSYNRFEAARELNDHCLHSTVSTIQTKGVQVARCDEVVSGYLGIPTFVCRYWLTLENTERALNLLGLAKWHVTEQK